MSTRGGTKNVIAEGKKGPPCRLASLDAYRGFVMLLMMAEMLRLHLLTGYLLVLTLIRIGVQYSNRVGHKEAQEGTRKGGIFPISEL